MASKNARNIALASSTGVLYPLCFPSYDLGILAWIVLIPLHLVILEVAPGRAFWLGWLSGTIAFVGTMSWVVTAMNQYGQTPLLISYALMLLLAIYLGAYVACYAAALAWLLQALPVVTFVAAPCIWVTLELIRTYLFSGLPWSLLGYSQYQWLPIIQVADHVGVYGLSFLVVLVNAAITVAGLWTFHRWYRQPLPPAPWLSPAAAIVGMSIALFYGYTYLGQEHEGGSTDTNDTIKIGIVQANIDQGRKWDPAFRMETLKRYGRLTAEAAPGMDLVLWPEAATPFIFERELDYRKGIAALVRSLDVPLLLGSPALRYFPDGRPYLHNSAYLITRDGRISGRYDKQHLVPFGEYVPFRNSLLFFVDKLAVGIGDFEPGPGPTLLEVSSEPSDDSMKFGVVICYEVIFPDLVREFAAKGADFMVTITNDAWFGDSVAPFQHFGMVVLRAVENRVAFARAANTGISGFIDPRGRILLDTPVFREQAIQGEIPISATRTFYTQYGDVFAYACVIISGILILGAHLGKRYGVRGQREETSVKQ